MQELIGKRVAFCGRLENEKRKTVIARLELAGGRYAERLSTKTDILVLPQHYDTAQKNKLLQEAEALQEQGSLEIVWELDFLSMLEG